MKVSPPRLLVVLAALGLIALAFGWPRGGGSPEGGLAPPAEGPAAGDDDERRRPPDEAALRQAFETHRAAYEAQRDVLLALPSPSVTLQTDFLAWGRAEQRTEMEPGRWWAPGEVWYDLDEVLADAGLEAEAFERAKAFLVEHEILAMRKIGPVGHSDGWIEFIPRQGHLDHRVQRLIVWHEDLEPRREETRVRVSETTTHPQHMRETSLPAPGWFVRETVIDR